MIIEHPIQLDLISPNVLCQAFPRRSMRKELLELVSETISGKGGQNLTFKGNGKYCRQFQSAHQVGIQRDTMASL